MAYPGPPQGREVFIVWGGLIVIKRIAVPRSVLLFVCALDGDTLDDVGVGGFPLLDFVEPPVVLAAWIFVVGWKAGGWVLLPSGEGLGVAIAAEVAGLGNVLFDVAEDEQDGKEGFFGHRILALHTGRDNVTEEDVANGALVEG